MTTPDRPEQIIGTSRGVIRKFQVIEEASLRMAESAMSNYRDANLAILDLVDNGVDNRIEGQPLTIYVRIMRGQIDITNKGGEGLDLEGFQNFLRWGISSKGIHQIGQYGVGGKAAMGFLGRSLEIRASAKGANAEYRFFDPDWETKLEQSSKLHEAEERTASENEGYFHVRITNLKNRRIDTNTVSRRLGETYRPILADGSVRIFVNGKPILPLEIKYLETDPNFRPERRNLQTGFGDIIRAQVGLFEEGQTIKPGIRCYYRGRLIEDGHFFGMPTPAQMPQASRLTGEVHLNHLLVTMNKSNFISDVRWEDALDVIKRQMLEPLYQKLATLRVEAPHKLEDYEKNIANDAKRALEHVLAHHQEMLSKNQLPGEAFGRLPPTLGGEQSNPTGRKRRVGPIEGATAPDIRATKAPTVKRWGALYNWEPVSMGNSSLRSAIVDEDGREILRVNIDFEGYQAAKKAGKDALFLYQAETAIIELCQQEYPTLSPVEFIARVNELIRLIGISYNEGITAPSNRRALRGGSINFRK